MEPNKSLNIPNNSMILLNKTGITSELIEEINNSMLSTFSERFHNQLIERKILSSGDRRSEWFKDGFSAQMIAPGEDWEKGKLRLRIVAEFIPDDIESEEIIPQEVPTSSVSPSLDDIRNSIETN